MELTEFIIKGCQAMGIQIGEKEAKQFIQYKEILLKWNEKMNLTAITDETEVIIKHFFDSLSCCQVHYLNGEGKGIDVGTGAGFPGIPIKIVFPKIQITLLDSLNKRIQFLKEVCKQLDLKEVELIHGRAEDYGKNIQYREQYDFAVARAVAPLNVLVEYCLPFIKEGGYFICQKGPQLKEEIPAAQKAIDVLGGKIVDQFEVQLPNSDLQHSILVLNKIKKTPSKYPRVAGKPNKNPIK